MTSSSNGLRKEQKWFLTFLLSSFFVFALIQIEYPKPIFVYQAYYKIVNPKSELFCHSLNVLSFLPDISDTIVRKGKSIFLLETSCNSYSNGKMFIKPRQACAVESAAKWNPNRDVYLLFASPGDFIDEKTESDRFIKVLMSYPNVKVLHFDLERYVQGTPVENLWTSGKIEESKYPMAHNSDLLRLITLWKYGGIYLDLDVVVTKSLETLPLNFAGAESQDFVANGVLSFSHDGEGHKQVTSCLEDLSKNFDGAQWSYNGPQTITRMLHHACGTSEISKVINSSCMGFQILPPNAFYAIYYPQWRWFFDENQMDRVMEMTNKSYLVHVWNKMSSEEKVPIWSNVPYIHLAREHCPGVIENIEEYF